MKQPLPDVQYNNTANTVTYGEILCLWSHRQRRLSRRGVTNHGV